MAKAKGSRNAPFKDVLSSVLAGASTDLSDLRDEMVEWRDNMEGANMEHLPKYDEVTECVDALEQVLDDGFEDIDIDADIVDIEVSYTQDTRRSATSRSKRLDNVLRMMQSAVYALDDWLADPLTQDDEDENEETAEPTDQRDRVEELKDQLEGWVGDLEGVCFPGMF